MVLVCLSPCPQAPPLPILSPSPPFLEALLGWYEADSFSSMYGSTYPGNNTSATWGDKSGHSNHAMVLGSSLPIWVSSGMSANLAVLQGTAASQMQWPAGLLSQDYSLFTLARFDPSMAYNPGGSGRIFTSNASASACDWSSGFAQGPIVGVAMHGGAYVTDSAGITPYANGAWVLSSDQWGRYRSQGINRSMDYMVPGTWCAPQLTINGHSPSTGWQVAAVLVYGGVSGMLLSSSQVLAVEQWLSARYGMGESGTCVHVTAVTKCSANPEIKNNAPGLRTLVVLLR